MFFSTSTDVKALQWLIGFPLFLMSAADWSGMAKTLPRYEIHVNLRPEARNLSVDMKVTLPPEAAPRKSLQFKLRPDMGTPQVRLIAPKAAGALAVRKLGEEGDALHPKVIWEIESAASFPANQPISLHIAHSGGDKPSQNFYVGPEIVIATGCYPQFGKDFSKALGSLSLDMPSGFLAVASGERVSERVKGGRRSIDFRMTWPTWFSFTAAPYQVHKAVQTEGDIPVPVYLLRDRDFAADLVDVVRRSIAILEKEFGRPPYKEFAVVEFPTDPGMKATFAGASLDGFILMRSDLLDATGADPFYFGHEVGHQWWGTSVSPDAGGKRDKNGQSPIIYMINESIAQYSAIRVIEALRGPEAAKAFRDEQRENAMKLIAAGEDEPLADLPNGPTFYELSQAKGCLVYNLISQSIGADRLRRFFHEVASDHVYSSITWDEYAARLSKAAGAENQWLIDQWLCQKGLPVLDLKWTAGNSEVSVEINQVHQDMPLYRLRLPVRLVYTDGSAEMRNVDVAAQAQTSAVLPAGRAVSRVELDPERTLLWASPQEFATAVALKNATRAWSLWDNGDNEGAEKILKAALDARTAPDATPAEFLERYNYGWLIEEVYNKLPEALDQYIRALRAPVRDEKELPQLYVNIARVAAATGDKPLARWAAQAAIALAEARGEDARTKRIKERVQKYLE